MTREDLFTRLWEQYTQQNPSVLKVYESFTSIGEYVNNDHIAFRTFDDPRVDISVIEKPFLQAGYEPVNTYYFKEKKLKAQHYQVPEHPEEPKVFISQLLLDEVSPETRTIIQTLLNSIDPKIYAAKDLIFKGAIWGLPSFETYNQLRQESEYAAWLYVYGFRANHFTVSINSLKMLDTIEKVNIHLKNKGFLLNSSGGEIKGTREELLQQSSIMAEIIPVAFTEGTFEIPGCYYEFAIRYPDTHGNIYNGFIAKSADKIFESTNFYNKKG